MSEENNKKHHILVTGPGRSGTTFLMKLLTVLGIDTGFTKDYMPTDPVSRAGMEFQGLGGDLPYVIKNPKLMWQLPELLKDNPVIIDHVIVLVRDIKSVVASRVENVNKKPEVAAQDVEGGLEGVNFPEEQEDFFLTEFYGFFEFLSALNVPVTLLQYPRLALDGEYLYRKLRLIFDVIEQDSFLQAFDDLSDPTKVHQYISDNESHSIQSIDKTELGQNDNKFLRMELQNFRTELQRLRELKKFIQQQRELLQQKNRTLQAENEAVRQEVTTLLSSRSWKFTKPLRFIGALVRNFGRTLTDFEAQIRTQVWTFRQSSKVKQPLFSRYFVEPFVKIAKIVIKPILHMTTHQLIGRLESGSYHLSSLSAPYESQYEANQDFSKYRTDVKAIAFYLPQYHEIPENNQWWGEGFTEWTNTKKAKPLFIGHYQPKEPHDDIGHYDLSNIDVLRKQAELARQHGIYGFCFYHYYFQGKRLLEKPVDMLMEHPEIDIDFCLCWANENWTKKWDGADGHVLVAQKHSAEDDLNFIKDLSRYLKDPRYIRVDGKPVVMVYRPLLLPELKATFTRWRQYCRETGIGEIVIWGTRGCFNEESSSGLKNVLDAEVEFPPHLPAPHKWIRPSSIRGNKLVYPPADYKSLVEKIIYGETVADRLAGTVYRTAMLGWDNTARRGKMGNVFYGYSTHLYYRWLKYNIQLARKMFPPENRFVLINAWNEWAEGTYLEPDKKYGYANINVTSRALFDLPYNFEKVDVKETKKQPDTLLLHELVADDYDTNNLGTVAVHAHVFHTDLIDEMIYYINNIPVDFDCYITTDTEDKRQDIENKVNSRLVAQKIEVMVTPNIGRDVAPFIVGCHEKIKTYDYVCHIHTKKTVHNSFGDDWRVYLLDHLLGGQRLVKGILSHFKMNPTVGLIYPSVFPPVKEYAVWGANYERVKMLLKRAGIDQELPETPVFPAGNMTWIRTKAFESLLNAGITYDDFEPEDGQLDGTLAHAFERSLVYVAKGHGYSSLSIAE